MHPLHNADKPRCTWPGSDALMLRYHDDEWGVPLHDDRKWFEFLLLDAFQAGLSWKTVLHKREAFRKVFHGFDPRRVARMSDRELAAALENPAIIRNRLKVQSAVRNARAFLSVQAERGSFDDFIWDFTEGRVIRNHWARADQVPAATPLSDRVSKALKAKGFSFVGTTICYAFLQAAGVVNDHLTHCFRHSEINAIKPGRP
ncbi:DNA-3-methyladenine glycosylase I [Desulfatitalea alkaliphila]|uniref:DNA-3-methyladenine glycosylase I n=1 Tax=Desulfatitalea alkaliphila TaxID=2929485 RepID=A0AA41ULR0_9BACT|nr:DNA-3-methyladenine glycosylase I [Desulfatitalea alkaliphila]MCJ8502662.1 DNA-3-methyladenine glycosylase I [Desulfatitalea alkaliphila]